MKINKWAALSVTAFALALVVSSAFVAYAAEDGTDEPCRPDRAGRQEQRAEHREQMKEFFTEGDYEAWAEFMADKPMAEEFVTEETFSVLVAAHELMEAGDKEGAHELLQDSGIKRPHFGKHKGPKPTIE